MAPPTERMHTAQRLAMLRWTAGLGAVTAEALAEIDGCSVASARARLGASEGLGLLSRSRPLRDQPSLYAITRAGLRACGMRGFDPPRLGAANAAHSIACAAAAARLSLRYPGHRVVGEPELRLEERQRQSPPTSARLGIGPAGQPLLHRPDLVLWPPLAAGGLPVAIEVELTVKAPQRLLTICRAWARCRAVAGVLYLASPEVERPLRRAIDRAQAAERVVVVPLDAFTSTAGAGRAPFARTVPGDA
jgi:hypothetical protein